MNWFSSAHVPRENSCRAITLTWRGGGEGQGEEERRREIKWGEGEEEDKVRKRGREREGESGRETEGGGEQVIEGDKVRERVRFIRCCHQEKDSLLCEQLNAKPSA